MNRLLVFILGLLVGFFALTTCYADQTVIAQKVDKAPVIDGTGNDPVWAQATEYTTYDEIAKINVTLKAIYTDTEIFFLVSFPDSDESNTHKTWTWDKATEMYKEGPEREDGFVFKWNMETNPVDLSVYADNPYTTDIWFWKACRTNPVGFADDKIDRLTTTETPKSLKLTTKSGKTMYLKRDPDSGSVAFEDTLYEEYKSDKMPRFTIKTPTGSCADIKAKGVWSGGKWTIEFARSLNTGNKDDIQFDTSKSYLFGVSRYEIGGKKEPDPKVSQPLFNCGDVGEALTLTFGK